MELIDANELLKHALPAKRYDPEMLVIGMGYVHHALRHPEDGWRADAAEKRADEAEATVRRMRALLEEVIDSPAGASTCPDGPCLDRDLRKRIKDELTNAPVVERAEDSAILDWLETHGISVRIQQNEQQSFMIPATREAIRFEMTAGNVEESSTRPQHCS